MVVPRWTLVLIWFVGFVSCVNEVHAEGHKRNSSRSLGGLLAVLPKLACLLVPMLYL